LSELAKDGKFVVAAAQALPMSAAIVQATSDVSWAVLVIVGRFDIDAAADA